MSKAMLIMDMPENCRLCPCSNTETTWCQHRDKKIKKPNSKPKWCKIRELPEKKKYKNYTSYRLRWCVEGFNACIDEILGGGNNVQTNNRK